MHDHNLDDLIIDNIEPKNRKTKSFLTIVALLIVVLIVAIILTKILLKTPEDNGLKVEDDTSAMIAPELKLQEAPKKVGKPKDELSLSNIIEQEIKHPAAAPKKPKVIEKPKPIAKPKPVAAPVPVKKEKISEEVLKETVTITKEYTQIPQPDKKPIKVIKAPKPETKITPVTTEIPKPIAVPKKVPQPVTPPKAVANMTYYIQVGSFTKDPSARFLSVIKKSGFNYKITKPASNGVKKLLIGPYENRASVDTALVRVRDRINKKAFVVKK